jgi:lysophospholipase L1-like esterase
MKNRDNCLLKWIVVVEAAIVFFCSPVLDNCGSGALSTPLASAEEVDIPSHLECEAPTESFYDSGYDEVVQAPTDMGISEPQQAPVDQPPAGMDWSKERVLLFGDSLAVGLAPFIDKELFERGVSEFKSISVGGTMINQWAWSRCHAQARSLDRALAEFKPTMVIFSLGTNDEAFRGSLDHRGDPIKPPYGPNFSVARLRRDSIIELSEKLARVRTRVWLCPPVTPRWPPDRAFREAMRSWGGGFFDTQQLNLSRQSDRLHMTPKGTRTWTSAIMGYLDSL